jgi:predicted TIM-barrel fold metal-dependent hydrolase
MHARLAIAALLLVVAAPQPGASLAAPASSDVYLVDTHSQVEGPEVNSVIAMMDRAGVYRTILSAIGDLGPTSTADLAQRFPGRIVPAVTTKGPGYGRGNPSDYYARLASQVNSGRFTAMAEVLIYHAEKGDAPAKIVAPDDPLVQTALRYALERGWPFIMHIEFAAIGYREDRDRVMRQFEAVLAAHPRHPFLLIHMGQLHAAEVQRLIDAHSNLYFQTSATIPDLALRSGQPWVNLFARGVLMPEWRRVFVQYPDRFVFALDAIGQAFSQPEGYYMRSIRYWRAALANLPPGVAEAVAHGNAERLWKLPPKAQ